VTPIGNQFGYCTELYGCMEHYDFNKECSDSDSDYPSNNNTNGNPDPESIHLIPGGGM
jgi:hypothetical protein